MSHILTMSKGEKIREVKRTLIALLGATIYAASINFFVVPSNLYSGGIMGICQLIRTILVDYLLLPIGNIDIAGIIYYVINIPILLIAWKRVGRRFFVKTVICVTWITIVMTIIPIPASLILPDDLLANCIIGGILSGLGVGIALKMGTSGGGMDVVGIMLIKWKKNFSVGQVNLFVNVILYVACLFMFNIPTAIYSLIFAAIASVACDRVHSQNINVEVMIISKHATKEMENQIFTELQRGITKWESQGAYTHEPAEVFYILLSKYEVGQLKEIVRRYDKKAFIVVNEGVRVEGNYLKKL